MIVTSKARTWVKFLRHFGWTLAARRQEWRADKRYVEAYDSGEIPRGIEKKVEYDADGKAIKTTYIDHGYPDFMRSIMMDLMRDTRLPRV